MPPNTLFLRLEGPMQAWGAQESKFVIRRTTDAPTKSGVIGLLGAALGVARPDAANWLGQLSELRMGVRIDRPGIRWWDYHTVGAGMQMRTAEGPGKTKPGAMLTRREYLCDASFLVAIQGAPDLIAELSAAIERPKWTLYLGRKSCPPSRPLLEFCPGVAEIEFPDPLAALAAVPWRPRIKGDDVPGTIECYLDWSPSPDDPIAPRDATVCYDVPLSFDPPAHRPRFVVRHELKVGSGGQVLIGSKAFQRKTSPPPRPRANYGNSQYRKVRKERLDLDYHLCTVCKSHATTVQHVTYRHAGGGERLEELRALCRLCHDAVTMLEYGLGMGLDRINPEIVKFRSLETRRRKLTAEEVE
jgi:CRISPR-associated protein Cas5/CasD subtype I-E